MRLFLNPLAPGHVTINNDAGDRAADGAHPELRFRELQLAREMPPLVFCLRQALLGHVGFGAGLIQRLLGNEVLAPEFHRQAYFCRARLVVRLRGLDLGRDLARVAATLTAARSTSARSTAMTSPWRRGRRARL